MFSYVSHSNTAFPSTLPASHPNVLPCIQPTFDRRTSRHCQGTGSQFGPNTSPIFYHLSTIQAGPYSIFNGPAEEQFR